MQILGPLETAVWTEAQQSMLQGTLQGSDGPGDRATLVGGGVFQGGLCFCIHFKSGACAQFRGGNESSDLPSTSGDSGRTWGALGGGSPWPQLYAPRGSWRTWDPPGAWLSFCTVQGSGEGAGPPVVLSLSPRSYSSSLTLSLPQQGQSTWCVM